MAQKTEEKKTSPTQNGDGAVDPVVVEETVEAVQDSVKVAVEGAVLEAVEAVKDQFQTTLQEVIEEAQEAALEAHLNKAEEQGFRDQPREAKPHAFVVMPFGKKEGFEGQLLDFNAIYLDLIKPALIEAGFEPFRADEETVSGDILTDMFQELLLADLVICDMSIDNANVFYELGVRHAFRKRGVIHIQSGRAYMPFDVFNVRTIPYHTNEKGVPDPEFLEKDRKAIARVTRDTYGSDQDAIHSPIFNLLTGLNEPERINLRTPLATGFWREYNEWKGRVEVAQRQKRIGDILLMTEEISNPLIKEEAIGEAGRALRSMGHNELALKQYRQGLDINPKNVEFRHQESLLLNRLGRVDEAVIKLENHMEEIPDDTEAYGLLGRIYKDMWTDSWKSVEDQKQRLEEAFDTYHWLIKSIHTYLNGYRHDLNAYYPGVNALTLAILLVHLADQYDDPEDPDPEIEIIREILPELQGTLQFALETLALDEKSDYWTLVSLAELRVTTADRPKKVIRAYRKALTAARKNIFQLQSSLSQLEMLKSLDFRMEFVEAGISVLSDEIRRIRRKETLELDEEVQDSPTIEQVFLFSGHMIDVDDCDERRFPAEMEKEVKEQINTALDKFETDFNDIGITAGASAGGDIIFIETCLEKKMKVEIHLPYEEAQYIKKFVSYAGDNWVERYYQLRNHPHVTIRFQADHVGRPNPEDNPYERNNRWALYSSLILGIERVHLIALWDGKSGGHLDLDGQLVSNMVAQMRHMGGIVEHLNSTKFDYWKGKAVQKVGRALDALAGKK